jgi:hypothetical protein
MKRITLFLLLLLIRTYSLLSQEKQILVEASDIQVTGQHEPVITDGVAKSVTGEIIIR